MRLRPEKLNAKYEDKALAQYQMVVDAALISIPAQAKNKNLLETMGGWTLHDLPTNEL